MTRQMRLTVHRRPARNHDQRLHTFSNVAALKPSLGRRSTAFMYAAACLTTEPDASRTGGLRYP